MLDCVPPHYIELVCDAALKSFWRRNALLSFLRRCGVSAQFLSTWNAEESKRDFLNRLFPKLEASDAGIRLIHRMSDALVQQTTFPDLEGWEDSEQKKELGRKAVVALSEYRQAQQREAEKERDRSAARNKARTIQEEAHKRQSNLDKFSQRLAELAKRLGTQEAGYKVQDWFYELVDFFEVVGRRPYRVDGRQIDGSITVDGTTYLIELKFTSAQADAPDIDTFHKKVSSKADNTMGVMISVSGFSSIAMREASGPKTPLLLLDHSHLYMLLGGTITFEGLVCRVRRHSSQTGHAYLSVQDFGG
jgi:hypothetical protein